MKLLANNCRMGVISVTPSNWKTGGKSLLKKEWRISYRFYDDNIKKSKLIVIRGFNRLTDIEDRRTAVQEQINFHVMMLTEQGYNPITKSTARPIIPPEQESGEITKQTPFLEALQYAKGMMKVAPTTMSDEIAPALKHVSQAAIALKYDSMSIGEVSLKHLYFICERAGYKKDGTFSADKHNRVRKVLGYFYKKLLIMEVVVANLPLSLERHKSPARKKKIAPNKEDRDRVLKYFAEKDPAFLRFIHIYFHSGARMTEILRLQVKDVNLKTGEATYLVLKGRRYEEKQRPIKDIALPMWSSLLKGAKPDDYVFSRGYVPGVAMQSVAAVRLKWQKVRKREDVNVTFALYDLKRLNSTQTAELLGTRAAALQNAESEDMIRKHYDLDHDKRINEQIKKLTNEL